MSENKSSCEAHAVAIDRVAHSFTYCVIIRQAWNSKKKIIGKLLCQQVGENPSKKIK